jgi:cytidylate kinase
MSEVRRSGGVIEIAGPAGSGKSTLVSALADRRPVHFGLKSCDRTCIPLAISRLHLLSPAFILSELRRGRTPREPLQSMVYLEFWLRQLAGSEYQDSGPVLYDHGPFFRLATIAAFGPPASTRFRNWWESMRETWSDTMTLVIWLDATDSVLLERIRQRNRGHPCEKMEDDEALAWLGRYRTAFDSSLEIYRRRRPEDLIRFDTSSLSPEELAATLGEFIDAPGG